MPIRRFIHAQSTTLRQRPQGSALLTTSILGDELFSFDLPKIDKVMGIPHAGLVLFMEPALS